MTQATNEHLCKVGHAMWCDRQDGYENWRCAPCEYDERQRCRNCAAADGEDRYSLGIYAAHLCNSCWRESGYRDEPASGFDQLDAGESYEAEE